MKIEIQTVSDDFFKLDSKPIDSELGYKYLDTKFTGVSSHPLGSCNDENCTHNQCVEYQKSLDIEEVVDKEEPVEEAPIPPVQTPRAAPISNNSSSGGWFTGTMWG